MPKRFSTPLYQVQLASGQEVIVDVTNSISAGLEPNRGLITAVSSWLQERGLSRVLDFGAGALRHTLPLLEAGFEVTAVEYERAYQRPKAAEARAKARRFDGFTDLIWPADFLRSDITYHVVILSFVLQVIPLSRERKLILDAVAARFSRNQPKRLYYASRFGLGQSLEVENKFRDGWIQGRGEHDRSFYTEWTAAETNGFFKRSGYTRAGTYSGAQQPFVFDYLTGIL